MHQVKLFKGVETEIGALEAEVNAWLAESGARVVEMSGNIAPQTTRTSSGTTARAYQPSDLFVMLLYEKA